MKTLMLLALVLFSAHSTQVFAQSDSPSGREVLNAVLSQLIPSNNESDKRWGSLTIMTGEDAQSLYESMVARKGAQYEMTLDRECSIAVKTIYILDSLGTTECFDRGENFTTNESVTRYKCYRPISKMVRRAKIERFYRHNNKCGGDGVTPLY